MSALDRSIQRATGYGDVVRARPKPGIHQSPGSPVRDLRGPGSQRTAWGIAFRGELIVSSIRMFRKYASEDYIKDIDLPGVDWKVAKHEGCHAVKVKIEVCR